jgi:hypothetical protein
MTLQTMTPKPITQPPPKLPLQTKISEQVKAESPVISIEAEHLKNIDLREYETSGLAMGNSQGKPENDEEISLGKENNSGDLLTKDEFFNGVFRPMHDIPSALTKLHTLKIHEQEMEAARRASDAIYDTALESSWFRWLIQPGNVYIQRAFVVYAYVAPKSAMVRQEILIKKGIRHDSRNSGASAQTTPQTPQSGSDSAESGNNSRTVPQSGAGKEKPKPSRSSKAGTGIKNKPKRVTKSGGGAK